jgi:putative endonuclease
MRTSDPWFVYLARCTDGTLYCGVARDVAERIAKHDAGKGARYTRGRGPLKIEAIRKCRSHGDALRLELAVKRLPREAKEALADTRRFRAFQRAVSARSANSAPGSAQQRKPVE